MNSQDLRDRFIQFFLAKQHTEIPGSSIVPENDPSLLFINAGMNQFKSIFLGEKPTTKRAVNSQICIRVSGKHNDLEDVGKDLTHLTSFEMLGNWSFGDYYKKEAITWAWEFLTQSLKIPQERLVATVFNDDKEALELWKTDTTINHHQIVTCDEVDNFWEMGKTGPCGPCSEIHVYLKDEPLPELLTQDVINNGDFVELWNLVFIQYNRTKSGSLENLPEKHIDTGAGFERLLAYLQGTASNYNTDLFQPSIQKIAQLSGVPYQDDEQGMPHRVIADHVRTLCFGIADNVYPSNEGRGYVLRRLLRRACRYAKKLGIDKPVLVDCVDEIIDSLMSYFGHLDQKREVIKKVILAEENSFLETLSAGLQVFEKIKQRALKTKLITGEDAFKLYDTYGFPIDLSRILAEEANLSIDEDSFQACLNQQKKRSRTASGFSDQQTQDATKKVSTEAFKDLPLHLAEDLNVAKGGEARIIHDNDEKLAMARHHTATHLLHESLRLQLGDHVFQAGSLVDSDRLRFDFSHFESVPKDTLKNIETQLNDWIKQHNEVKIDFSSLDDAKANGAMALFGEKYDKDRVRLVSINSISTELCAGTHVKNTQQIQAVKILSESAISAGTRRIEAIAGEALILDHLNKKIMHNQEKINKTIQKLSPEKQAVDSAIQTQLNPIITLASDTKQADSIPQAESRLTQTKSAIHSLSELTKTIQKDQAKLKNQHSQQKAQDLQNKISTLAQGAIVTDTIPNADMKQLRQLSDQLVSSHPNLIAILAGEAKGKGIVVVKVGPQVTVPINAQEIMTKITTICQGSGGGRPDMAQAGGCNLDTLQQALTAAEKHSQDALS